MDIHNIDIIRRSNCYRIHIHKSNKDIYSNQHYRRTKWKRIHNVAWYFFIIAMASLGITYHIHILYAYDFVSLKRFYDFPFIFQAKHLWVGSCLFIWPSAIYLVYVAEWYSICLYVNENSWIWNDMLNIACLEYLWILKYSMFVDRF